MLQTGVVMCNLTVGEIPAYIPHRVFQPKQLIFLSSFIHQTQPRLTKAISQNSGQIPRVTESIEMLPPASIFGCNAPKLF